MKMTMKQGRQKDEYWLLGNPIRRRILQLLAERKTMQPTQLREELNISYGTLYYHLNLLKKYIEREKDKRLKLSPEGWKALTLIEETETIRKLKLDKIIKIFEEDTYLTIRIIIAIIVLSNYIIFDYLYGLRTSLMLTFVKSRLIPLHQSIAHVIGNWLTFSAIIIILTIIIAQRKLNLTEITHIMLNLTVAISPILIYLWAMKLKTQIDQQVYVISQALTTILLIAMLIGTIKIRSERAAIITLIAMYSTILMLQAVAIILL